MPKTGWKYTKQVPNKATTNQKTKSTASSKPGRVAKKGDLNMRSEATIQRLKMYQNGKAIRNKEGKIVGGQFMMKDRAGDSKITASTGRIAPDRRWFGNTRVVGATELDRFREEMTDKVADPYSVVLRRKKLPMGLLQDAAELAAKGGGKNGLLANEPFETAFGSKSRRKRVKLDQYLVPRASEPTPKEVLEGNPGGSASVVPRGPDDDESGYGALLAVAQQSEGSYQTVNTREGIVPWGRDSNVEVTEGEGVDWRKEKKDDLFLKGQSKRIWGEFYKVIDCSDVVIHVIDARNVPGTRCLMIEKHIAKNASHKHLVFVLNKIDLVPNWVAKRWIGELAKTRPTIGFHASMTHAFGKGALISLLRQFGKLHDDKKQISVGVIGYPNVGKSSVINTLISKKSCKVAPIPGETRIWQYISLFKRISLIDCPGVVVDTANDTETDSVLKGVVRAERLETPEEFVGAICEKVKREHIAAQYKLPKDGEETWKTSQQLMEMISQRAGRLLKGGEPCLRSAAVTLINDYQRGRLPHYVPPPELKEDEPMATIDGIRPIVQDLDAVGIDTGKLEDMDEEEVEKPEETSDASDSEDEPAPIVTGGTDWDDEN
jgi:nuclear GTP-binding protein